MFSFYIHHLYNKTKIIIIVLLLLITINSIYYMYWLYYLYSMFTIPISSLSLITTYNDSLYQIQHQLPVMEINMSLFDIQNTILYFLMWNIILFIPYLLISSNMTHHYDTYCVIFLISILQSILYLYYIPFLMQMSMEYYQLYQIEKESVHINVEYKVIEILYSILCHLVIVYSIIIILFIPLPRLYATLFYIIITPWNQPIYIFIGGLILLHIAWEMTYVISYFYFNYLKKIAGHCTGIDK